MTSEIEAHAAALRNAPLQHGEHAQLAAWLVLSEDVLDELNWEPDAVNKLGMQRARVSMQLVDRLHTASALLMIAAEFARMTPFQQWFQRNHTKEERERFTERDLKMMEIGFTNYGRQ